MIKCFRCDQEITNLEDIGKISRAKREYYMGTDICFCKKCTNELPQLMDEDLTEWYQLVNVTETVCGIKENVSRLPERVIEKKPVLSDEEIEMIESEETLRELEDEGAIDKIAEAYYRKQVGHYDSDVSETKRRILSAKEIIDEDRTVDCLEILIETKSLKPNFRMMAKNTLKKIEG